MNDATPLGQLTGIPLDELDVRIASATGGLLNHQKEDRHFCFELEADATDQVTVIDLATITCVRHELADNAVTIESPAASPVRLAFTAAEVCDDVYSRLWARLGPAVELRPYRTAFWSAAREPLGVMAGVLLATLTLTLTVEAAADVAGPSFPVRLVPGLDWRLVAGLGGAGLALAQVWLYRRLTRPPACLELIRRATH